MTIMVTGSRNFRDKQRVYLWFKGFSSSCQGDHTLIQGCARGVDTWAFEICQELGWKIRSYPADWNRHGKKAGIVRNREMVQACKEAGGMVAAFWDGTSRGTKHAIDYAKSQGLEVILTREAPRPEFF